MQRLLLASALGLAAMLAVAPAAEAQISLVAPRLFPSSFYQVRAPLYTLYPVRTFGLTATTAPAPAPEPGTLGCRVEDNGAWAPGRFEVLRSGQRVAGGTCGAPLSLAAGTYDVLLTLESAVDRPQRSVRVTVSEGGRVEARASFATSILEVRFTSGGAPVYGTAIIRRDGQQIATLGSGVPARISAGRYEIVARYRTSERVYTVDLAPEQRRAIHATF